MISGLLLPSTPHRAQNNRFSADNPEYDELNQLLKQAGKPRITDNPELRWNPFFSRTITRLDHMNPRLGLTRPAILVENHDLAGVTKRLVMPRQTVSSYREIVRA